MAYIPGSIPITGFLGPTDSTDTYAVTDAIYGIDGLRNVADHTERNNISLARRRQGMVVGTMSDQKYWRLKPAPWTLGDPTNWELFLDLSLTGSTVVSAFAGVDNWVAKFTQTGTSITNSSIYDDGTNVIITADTVTFWGDVVVMGSATTLNTETVLVEDNILTLNSNYTAGTPTIDSGIEFLRGAAATVSLLWNETDDAFQFSENLQTLNNKIIKSKNGNSIIDLRAYNWDNTILIENDSGNLGKAWVYMDDMSIFNAYKNAFFTIIDDNNAFVIGNGIMLRFNMLNDAMSGGNDAMFATLISTNNSTVATLSNGIIVGGQDHYIASGLPNTVVIGGESIQAYSGNSVYVPYLNIGSASTDNAITTLLVRDPNGFVALKDASSIAFTGGSGSCIDDLFVNRIYACSTSITGVTFEFLPQNFILTTDGGNQNETGLYADSTYISLFANGWKQAIELINNQVEIYNVEGNGCHVTLGVRTGAGVVGPDDIKIVNNDFWALGTMDSDKKGIIIGSRNSGLDVGVANSVVLGGYSITGTSANTVYVSQLNIVSANTNNNLTSLLVRESDGLVSLRDASSLSFSGGSGNCITDLYVTNIYGCSPINMLEEVRVYGKVGNANHFSVYNDTGGTINRIFDNGVTYFMHPPSGSYVYVHPPSGAIDLNDQNGYPGINFLSNNGVDVSGVIKGVGTGWLGIWTNQLRFRDYSTNADHFLKSSDATFLFTNDSTGTAATDPNSRITIRGVGNTALTNGLRVIDNAGSESFLIKDDGTIALTKDGQELTFNGGAKFKKVVGTGVQFFIDSGSDFRFTNNLNTRHVLSVTDSGIVSVGHYYDGDETFSVHGLGSSSATFNTKLFNSGGSVLMSVRNDGLVQINGSLKYVDGNQASGKILVSDTGGTATWTSTGTLGLGTVKKYVETRDYDAGSATTVTHSLATEDVIVQLWNSNKQLISGDVEVVDSNTILITLSVSLNNVKVVIQG